MDLEYAISLVTSEVSRELNFRDTKNNWDEDVSNEKTVD